MNRLRHMRLELLQSASPMALYLWDAWATQYRTVTVIEKVSVQP